MPEQNLLSENQDPRFKEFFEFIGPLHRPRRKSFLMAIELLAILAFCVVLWQAGLGSLGEAVEIFFGLYFLEFCSAVINGNTLSKNIFLELPKFLYSHISSPQKNLNDKENAKLINQKNETTTTYGSLAQQIPQTQTLTNGTANSLPHANQLSLSVLPTFPSSSAEPDKQYTSAETCESSFSP